MSQIAIKFKAASSMGKQIEYCQHVKYIKCYSDAVCSKWWIHDHVNMHGIS